MNAHLKELPQQASLHTCEPGIMVFKTNIRLKKDLKKIEPLLNDVPGMIHWHIDREDMDKVLRLELANEITAGDIIRLMNRAGYFCEELADEIKEPTI